MSKEKAVNDRRMVKWLAILILLPIVIAAFGGDRFRYPCQDPKNWDKEFCQKPLCDVTRTCPEHVFKGQRDPRLGAPSENQQVSQVNQQGVNCGR